MKWIFVTCILLTMLLISSCSKDTLNGNGKPIISSDKPTLAVVSVPTPTSALFPFKVIDARGKQVSFDRAPHRIIAYDSAVVEILFAIEEGHRLVGTHDFVSFPSETKDIPKLGSAFNINIENIVAQEPDLVYIFFDRFLPDLERTGIPVLFQKTLNQDFTKIADSIRMWGGITGNPHTANKVAMDFEERVEIIRQKLETYEGGSLIFQDEGDLWSPGSDTLIDEVFQLLKLHNIAEDVSGYAQLSPEAIVERNPQIIIASYGDTISQNPIFEDVFAVKAGRVFVPSSDALSIPGPRFIDGIEELALWLYPEIFE